MLPILDKFRTLNWVGIQKEIEKFLQAEAVYKSLTSELIE